MQVKKFEARTMKEAIEMVKRQLGPEAIILAARDNRKSYGLVGEGSVEITAAVPDGSLHAKKFAESKMREADKEKFQNQSARIQKAVLEKFVQRQQLSRSVGAPRYAEILDDHELLEPPTKVSPMITEPTKPSPINPLASNVADQNEIASLKQEILSLKAVISQFQAGGAAQNSSTFPGASYGLPYDFSHTFDRLTSAGVSEDIAAEMLIQAKSKMPPIKYKNKSLIDGFVAKQILEATAVVGQEEFAQVHLFLGPAGSGKTSTMIKIAADLAVNKKKKIVLLTADNSKIGAVEQMRTFAQILNVPFAVVRRKSDWPYLMGQLSSYDHILCDFSAELENCKVSLPEQRNQKFATHLVLSAMSRTIDLEEQVKKFKNLKVSDLIFTNVDQTIQKGHIFSVIKTQALPIFAFGIGTAVPEDIEYASKERVLDFIFQLSSQPFKEKDL